ncbi:MAG: NAD(P)-dependent oxidoreductase [Alphaproteobacteria bacterium]|jgi:3-hydroxyisobutyrate dehydrogenase-like beta-hydroxyacid dehydrogenase|nr:NAD(P)-dependent oxidoreductase [Alphaproteobacteria bacterium]MBO6865109.1 NAD(P)-dependent oxidoreductase [Alphaproteobacteria bacterium]
MRIGFVGTGIMGAPMARNLARGGFAVTAWNRSRAKSDALRDSGISVAETAAQAADGADLVIVMLSDGPTCDHVLNDQGDHGAPVLPAMASGSRLVVMSSIPVETARDQAERAAARGVGYLDAPVSGGEKGATEATLAIMAGGAQEDFDALRPAFSAMGRPTLVGPAGAGQLAKLANQIIVGNTLATVAEALIFAERGGADPAAVRQALLGGFADSTILQQHGLRMCEGNWTPGGFSKYQLKDLRTAMAFAATLGLDLPVSGVTTGLYEDTVAHGDGDKDQSAVFLELTRRNAR